jgi:hypothetical protein
VASVRRRRSNVWGWVNIAGATAGLAAFVLIIGVPMTKRAMADPPPKNPATPSPVASQTGLPVFPGAEGFGTRTPAGRGGKVIAVTSLADAGPGSLRAALDNPAPRTIVFRVAGVIDLSTPIRISHPYVTVAGQTAPGDGICLRNAGLVVATHDVLIQHIRIRLALEARSRRRQRCCRHPRQFRSRRWRAPRRADHISASWSEDELVSTCTAPATSRSRGVC